MPKFIGNTIPGSVGIHDNACATDDRIRISYSQAVLLPPGDVMHSLDTSDRGGIRQKAKRWYRWFTTADAIARCPRSTANMHAKAGREVTA